MQIVNNIAKKLSIIKIKLITGFKEINFCFFIKLLSFFLPVNNKKVLFFSDVRKNLDGNLKNIYDKLDVSKCIKVVILNEKREERDFNENIELLYNMVTAKYILLEDQSKWISLIKPRRGQEICQLWHGAGAFKKIGYSRKDRKKVSKKYCHRNYTKACVTADYVRECYSEGFGMPIENIKATGMARTDIFFKKGYIKKKKEELYSKHPYLKDKKVILFAPTYRGKSIKLAYYDFEKLNINRIYNRLKDKNYVFLFKWHPGLYMEVKKGNIEIPYKLENYPNFYYDFSDYRDINNLLLITDVLVTDYSSVIFDYALLNKPIVYFAYDLKRYEKERGLYFDFEEYIYGDVAQNTTQLIDCIKNAKVIKEKRETFIKKFMEACDGNATQKTCEWIFKDNLDFIRKD